MNPPRPCGVFAGLATLDVIHRIDAPPGPNQKVTARAQFVAAELREQGEEVIDIVPTLREGVPVSSVTVLDAGRWKPIMDELVGAVTDVAATADFRTPGATTADGTATGLHPRGAPPWSRPPAQSRCRGWENGRRGETRGPQIDAVDALGAGDVFYGAYAYALAAGADVEERIRDTAEVAAIRCSMVGPRSWVGAVADVPLGTRGRRAQEKPRPLIRTPPATSPPARDQRPVGQQAPPS